jgi:hypothetical protein
MKPTSLAYFVVLLFWVLFSFVNTATCYAQTTDKKTADIPADTFSKSVWQKLDSIKTAAMQELWQMQSDLKNMDVAVDEGKLVVQGKAIDIVTPMSDILSGVEQIGKAIGMSDVSLDPLRDQVNEAPHHIKAGIDLLKDVDWGLNAPPNATPKEDNSKNK